MQRNKTSLMSRVSAIAIILGSLHTAPAVMAQDTTLMDEDEIIVSARRVAETLIETPVAVAAFNEDAIDDLGLRSIDDIARHTAGFSFSQAFGRTTERPVIRGAANILAGVQFGVEAGAAYFIDGVYYSGDMQALDTRGLSQVEVIKGAQSALYGRNTYSGAINFITKRPSQSGFEGSLEAVAAEDGEREYYARVSNSIDDVLGFSLSGRFYEYDGDSKWINAADGSQLGSEETFSLNAVVDVQMNDNFSVIARLGYTEDNDGPRPFRLIGTEANNCAPGYRSGEFYAVDGGLPAFLLPFAPFGGIFPSTPTTDSNFQYFCGDLSQFEDLPPTQDLDSGPYNGVERDMIFGTFKADYDFGSGHELLFQAGLRDQRLKTGSDSDHQVGTSRFFAISPFFSIAQADGNFYNGGISESFDYSAEIRLASPVEQRVRWSVGAFYYHQDDETAALSLGFAGPDFEGPFDTTRTVENKAVFASLDFDITDALELSLEARYQEEVKGLVEFDNGLGAAPTYPVAPNLEPQSFTDFIPKAILSYDINDQSSAYLSYARGVKPGGVNGPIGIPTGDEFYEPEESDAFEVGFKTRTWDGKGSITLAAYYNDIAKYQLTTPVAVAGSTAVNSVATNQGDAEIMGFEFQGNYDLTDYLSIGGSYAYTDAEFTSGCDDFQFTINSGGFLIQAFDIDDPSTQGFIRNPLDASVGAGLSTPLTDPAGYFTGNLSCSIAGNKIPMTSKHQFSAYGSFEAPISATTNIFANLDFTHESSKFIQVHNLMETGDTNMLGGKVGLRRGGARVELFARNILNERTPPISTRWFDVMEGFNTVSDAYAGAGRGSIDRSPVGPRGTFLSFRRGTQLGVRASMDF